MAGKKLKPLIIPADESFEMTYIALMLLLLCFMVIMVSLAQIDDPRFKEAIGSVRGAFSFLSNKQESSMIASGGPGVLYHMKGEESKKHRVERLRETLEAKLGDDFKSLVRIEETEHGIQVTLGGLILFDPGAANTRTNAAPVLDEIAAIAQEWTARVIVSGHTDDLPIRSPVYASNWELSVSRAATVVRYLENKGVPGTDLTALGLAHTRPLVPNNSIVHRLLNRRVEISIEYDDPSSDLL